MTDSRPITRCCARLLRASAVGGVSPASRSAVRDSADLRCSVFAGAEKLCIDEEMFAASRQAFPFPVIRECKNQQSPKCPFTAVWADNQRVDKENLDPCGAKERTEHRYILRINAQS